MAIDYEQVKKILIPKYFYEIIVPQMGAYYSDYGVDFDVKPVAKCPLHGEDTPSFRWYEETNTFFCFGCRKGGDVINLHREFAESVNGTKPSFKEAMEFLAGFFINGRDDNSVFSAVNEEEIHKLSSVPELILLSNYIKRLEDKLIHSVNVPMEIKRKIYTAIDNTNLLTSLNMIKATDALSYIKHIEKVVHC